MHFIVSIFCLGYLVTLVLGQECLKATDAQLNLYRGKCSMGSSSRTVNGVTTTCQMKPVCQTQCIVPIYDQNGKLSETVTLNGGQTKIKEPVVTNLPNGGKSGVSGYKLTCVPANLNGVPPLAGVLPPPTPDFVSIPPKL